MSGIDGASLPLISVAGTAARWPRAWYVACRSADLRQAPLALRLLELPLVLFRDAAGGATALLDRCPHRNAPLSAGECRDGRLRCPYHGWRFDAQGLCVEVPGLPAGAALPSGRAQVFAVEERDGLVWVWPFLGPPDGAPTVALPCIDDRRYRHHWFRYDMPARWQAVVENILDVPHTAFVHRGLFRRPEGRTPLQVQVSARGGALQAQYLGEPAPSGWMGRVLAAPARGRANVDPADSVDMGAGGSSSTVTHYDRYLWPTTAQVEYALGDMHWVGTHLLTPESANSTLAHLVISERSPGPLRWLPRWLVAAVVQAVGKRLLLQDRRILTAQAATLQHFGAAHFASSELDAFSVAMQRLMRIEAAAQVADELVNFRQQQFAMLA